MAIVRAETWTVRNGKVVRLNRPPRGNQQSATKTTTLTVHVGGTSIAPLPYPSYTDYPTVDWTTLDTSYASRNLNLWAELPDVDAILRAMPSRAYVKLPDGFRGKYRDFKSGGSLHGILAPNCMGLWGNGPDKAVIRMEPMTSTKVSSVPLQSSKGNNPLIAMRLGPASPTVTAGVHCYGFAFGGTDQPLFSGQGNSLPAHPHPYHGIRSYYETGATYDWMEIFGFPGDRNSPPGETKQHTFYRGRARNSMRFCHVSGFQERGIGDGSAPPTDFTADWGRMCGSGIASFGSEDPYWESVNTEDCYVSGAPDTSSAGDPITGTMTHNATWKNCRSNNNGNHFAPNPGGMSYKAANMEGAYGNILYDRCDFGRMDNQVKLQNAHLFIGNGQVDCPQHHSVRADVGPDHPRVVPVGDERRVHRDHAAHLRRPAESTGHPSDAHYGGVHPHPGLPGRLPRAGLAVRVNPLTQFCVER
jgi:hypothetical protein